MILYVPRPARLPLFPSQPFAPRALRLSSNRGPVRPSHLALGFNYGLQVIYCARSGDNAAGRGGAGRWRGGAGCALLTSVWGVDPVTPQLAREAEHRGFGQHIIALTAEDTAWTGSLALVREAY